MKAEGSEGGGGRVVVAFFTLTRRNGFEKFQTNLQFGTRAVRALWATKGEGLEMPHGVSVSEGRSLDLG